MGRLEGLVSELRRRRVFRALAAWGVLSFAVLQVVEPVLHAYHLPEWTLTAVVSLLAAGFPATALLAWAFDITSHGVTRTGRADPAAGGSPLSGARLALLLVALGLLAAAPGLAYFLLRPSGEPPTSPAGRGESPSPAPASIAVLPFADMSERKDQEYLADGLAEEILNALAQVDGLSVTGRTSSFSFRGKGEDLRKIGQKLGVAAVLEGSVRKSGNHIRVTAQLVKVADGFHLWSKTFDRDVGDIFAVQDEIARAVVAGLEVKLLPGRTPSVSARQTSSPEAYEHYLRGKDLLAHYGFPGTQHARAEFERAIALDPGYGLAFSELAMALALLSDWATAEDMPGLQRRAFAAADRGVELSPEIADTWARRAVLRLQIRWDWKGADGDAKRALELNPRDVSANAAMAWLLAARGRVADAIRAGRRAVELDPLDMAAWVRLHMSYVAAGEKTLAREALDRATQSDPTSESVLFAQAYAALREGQPAEAIAIARRLADKAGQETSVPKEDVNPLHAASLIIGASASRALGHEDEARRIIDELSRRYGYFAAYQVAEFHAQAGDREQALAWLERAYRQHDGGFVAVMPWCSPLALNSAFANLRQEPRFTALLEKLERTGGDAMTP